VAFDQFLSKQEEELADMGWMRNMMEVERLRRMEMLNDQFRNALMQNVLLSGAIGGIAAMMTAFVMAKNITGPLSKMEKGMSNVIDNEYKGRLEEEGPYEVRSLMAKFNQLLEELDRIEKLRADLISDITHELRTPLTKIQGQLEGIQDGVYEANDKLIRNLLDNTAHLEDIITRLQELIDIKSGQVKLKKVNIHLDDLVNSVLSGYKKEGVEVSVNIDNDLVIKADKIKFRELLDNIIGNAFKYTTKGNITIEGNKQTLKVADSGIGIPKNELPFIFERFYRVDKSRSVDTGGLGLGLAIAKEIAEAHGFKLLVESEYHKGSVFTVQF
jgi:signal transduction histidine kinase